MSYFTGVKCIRCGYPMGDHPFYRGCPVCASDEHQVNFTTTYDLSSAHLPTADSKEKGIFRYRKFYPIEDNAEIVSLGEGNTPLLRLERLGKELGIENLYVKNEATNPTASFKDRLMAVVATMVKHNGSPAITISSTGNHGAAAAAYSAAAGLPCVIFTVPEVPDTMKTLMQVYGACLVVVPTAIDRWKIMGQCVKEFGWTPASGFVSPPIGSNCYGIDGYKSIAFELYEQLGQNAPEMIIMPTAYCDGLYGTYKGMTDLKTMGYIDNLPKMVAAETSGPRKKTLQTGSEFSEYVENNWSVAFSIGGNRCTYQGLEAVRKSRGYARTSTDEETMQMQLKLASLEGIYAEASSVTTLVAAAKLAREGKISGADRVVAVLTSSGLKDPLTTQKYLPAPPLIEPEMGQLRAALADAYGVKI